MSGSKSRGWVLAMTIVAARGRVLPAALVLVALAPFSASAQDFTITAGQTVGWQIIHGVGDHGVIEAGGTITTSVDYGYGVFSTGANATITNSGTIAIFGDHSSGIRADGDGAVIANYNAVETTGVGAEGIITSGVNTAIANSGTVATSGQQASGVVFLGDSSSLANSGTIMTSGDDAHAILFGIGTNMSVTNSGVVATSGQDAFGIYSTGADAYIANSGAIATLGVSASAINAQGGNTTIENSGVLTTSGIVSHGIYSVGDNLTVGNSGTVVTTGYGAHGITLNGANAVINNSGTIISERADAISFIKGSATLNLLDGSIVQGGLYFSGTDNTLNFDRSMNAVMQLTGPGSLAVTARGNPLVLTGTAVAVLDRTGFVLTDAMALGLAGDLANGATSHVQQCLPLPGSSDCATTAWLGGFGSLGGQSESAMIGSFEQQRGGGLMGLEFGSRGGVFIGAVGAHGRAGSTYESGLQGTIAGGHAGFEKDGFFAEFYASLGILQIDSNRTVLDNSVAGGIDIARATQSGYFLNPAVTIGHEFATQAGALTPSLRLRYTGLHLDGYGESGASGLIVDSRMVHELDLRAQLALALPPLETEAGILTTTLRVGADLIHRQSDTVSAQLLGQPISFAAGGDGTRLHSFAAAEVSYAFAGGAALFGNVETGFDTAGGYSATAQAGIRGAF